MVRQFWVLLLVVVLFIPVNTVNFRGLKPVKAASCQIQDKFPDSKCTPGAVLDVSVNQICVKGYAKKVRKVTTSTKKEVYQQYGITSHYPGQYEVDHFIPLELGGSNDLANLWPEPANPRPGFHEKDKVENYLHQQVCTGKISLTVAQKEIQTNWLEVYQKIK